MRVLTILALFSVVWVTSCVTRQAHEAEKRIHEAVAQQTAAAAAAPKLTSNEEALAAAKGEVKRLTEVVEAEKMAPLQTSLTWAKAILGLCLLLEIGITVFLAYARMPWHLVAGLCVATAIMLAGAITLQAALMHVGWIIAGTVLVVAGFILWCWKHHAWVRKQGKLAWDAVPESTMFHPNVETTLERLFK